MALEYNGVTVGCQQIRDGSTCAGVDPLETTDKGGYGENNVCYHEHLIGCSAYPIQRGDQYQDHEEEGLLSVNIHPGASAWAMIESLTKTPHRT